jgi:hypothetical protein
VKAKKVEDPQKLLCPQCVSVAGSGRVAQPPTVRRGGGRMGGIKRDAADRVPRGDAGQRRERLSRDYIIAAFV